MKRVSITLALSVTILVTATLILSGCGKHKQPSFVYMPDMAYSPAVKAQKEGGMMVPPAGTMPRGFERYENPGDVMAAGKFKNPLPRTKANVLRGQHVYNIYCIVCHGPYGEGDGHIVPKFPRPPSLQSEKIKNYSDGSLFHVMTVGQNLMPSYASQVPAEDRWAVAHYIRALHRAKNPTPDDLKLFEQKQGK